jgi:hypothetical protein
LLNWLPASVRPRALRGKSDRPYVHKRLYKLAKEPPFRLAVRFALNWLPASVWTRALWGKSDRPHYLVGVLFAAEQAKREGVEAISAIEFGVAGGKSLVVLEGIAEAVEAATGVRISVYGFDTGGGGLPDFIGDHRDCPDSWRPGLFPMDVDALRARLSPRTTLVLGNIRDTVPTFIERYNPPPVGFAAIDVDLYSSTAWALQLLSSPERRMLMHVPLYFDDIHLPFVHAYAGEMLAINEFNERETDVKIDRWLGLKENRPFPEEGWLERMFMAHDLSAISRCAPAREPSAHPGQV